MPPSPKPLPGADLPTNDNGWSRSAQAWLRQQGQRGDFGRVAVLDPVMIPLAKASGQRFIDIGCGEGRFVRAMAEHGIEGVGIDPTEALIDAARQRDPSGDYHVASAEALPFADGGFDFALFYVSLCDISDYLAAVREAVRVVRPGGRILVANLASYNTAGAWKKDWRGRADHYGIDRYMEHRQVRQRWAGIDVVNWHRPLSAYMAAFLDAGLVMRSFLEPTVDPAIAHKPKFDRAPNFVVMVWDKP